MRKKKGRHAMMATTTHVVECAAIPTAKLVVAALVKSLLLR